jgi:hypothetical protein
MSEQDQATQRSAAVAAVEAVPDEAKGDVANAALHAVPHAFRKNVATAAVQALPDDAKRDVVAAAMEDASGAAQREVADAAVRTLSPKDQEALAERFLPDQPVTNAIWLMIVKTFAVVLIGSSGALGVAVIVSLFRTVDAAMVQVLLTVITTVAGILAGFISGRTSAGSGSK